jgi:predicted O-methyltransferase YrrM
MTDIYRYTDTNQKVIPSWTETDERNLLHELASQVQPKGLIVEIGALYGGTTAVLAKAAPKAKVISIDEFSWTPDGYPTATKYLLEEHLKEVGIRNVTVMEGKSEEIGKMWDKHIDFIFIDGGHSYQYVYADLCNFAPHANIVACHDYNNPFWETIKKAIDDFLAANTEWKLAEVVGTVAVLRRN